MGPEGDSPGLMFRALHRNEMKVRAAGRFRDRLGVRRVADHRLQTRPVEEQVRPAPRP